MFSRKGFLFNIDRCLGCQACVSACHNENGTPPGVRWRRSHALGQHLYLSLSCNHCDSPECFRICPQQAFSKRRNGIVLLDANLCDGCQECVPACPYQAPQYDPLTNKVSKCTYCYSRKQVGLIPACVTACAAGALLAVDLEQDALPGTVFSVDGFPDISLTNPSIRFYPAQTHERYWLGNSNG